MSSADVHDWAGRPVHDGDPAHGIIGKHLRRSLYGAGPEATPAEKALLRSAGEPVYGTCPACGSKDAELLVRNGRETCGRCPWERGAEVLEADPDELAELLGVPADRVREVVAS